MSERDGEVKTAYNPEERVLLKSYGRWYTGFVLRIHEDRALCEFKVSSNPNPKQQWLRLSDIAKLPEEP